MQTTIKAACEVRQAVGRENVLRDWLELHLRLVNVPAWNGFPRHSSLENIAGDCFAAEFVSNVGCTAGKANDHRLVVHVSRRNAANCVGGQQRREQGSNRALPVACARSIQEQRLRMANLGRQPRGSSAEGLGNQRDLLMSIMVALERAGEQPF